MKKPQFRRGDAVTFRSAQGLEEGHIASLSRTRAVIVVGEEHQYRVPLSMLDHLKDRPAKQVRTPNEIARGGFKTGVLVLFEDKRGTTRTGTLERKNPKYAKVRCGEELWQVPYINLKHAEITENGDDNRRRLEAISQEAELLLQKHGLSDWRFIFDEASRRGGVCKYTTKEIGIAEDFALHASAEEVTDTLLHEIAHALVGVRHHHDEVWYQKAIEIGCSGKTTHTVTFSEAPWLLTCTTCGWQIPRQRRRRGLHCRTCDKPVTYQRNTGSASSALSESIT